MKQDDLTKQSAQRPGKKPRWVKLLVGLGLLLLLMLLGQQIAARLIATHGVKQKIQKAVTAQTGGQINYEAIGIVYFPRPAIALRQVTLSIPAQVQGTLEELDIAPALFPLLSGTLQLTRIALKSPEFCLDLPAAEKVPSPSVPYVYAAVEKQLREVVALLVSVAPDLELRVVNGRFKTACGAEKLAEIAGLDLQLALSVASADSARIKLKGEIATLTLARYSQLQTFENLRLSADAQLESGKISAAIERLRLDNPALELTGDLVLSPQAPGVALTLSGRNIDVGATRAAALALAEDVEIIKTIFDYLRGGQVPQIRFTSSGAAPSALGDLANLRIEGQLQKGAVSIPMIDLDLTEVDGVVSIVDGVLTGSDLSTKLVGSSGHDGTLKVGLGDDADLFRLELMLSADLLQSQEILKRVVKNPDFANYIDRVTNLTGRGNGRLILGDRKGDLQARVDVSDLDFTADYEGVPFPIKVRGGRLAFAESQIVFKGLAGTLGASDFSEFDCELDWVNALHLKIASGRFGLDVDELFPWLVTFDAAKEPLREIRQLTGRLNLSSLSFNGAFDAPGDWQLAAAGALKGLEIETPLFPAELNLTRGDFQLTADGLSFQNLQAAGLDAELVLTGEVKGFPRRFDQVDLTLDGTMGADSVAWAEELMALPKAYAVRAPLALYPSRVVWQPSVSTAFKGGVAVINGPELDLDVVYRPEQLRVNRLQVKDTYSDAEMALDYGQEAISFNFTGMLQHETLNALFVNPQHAKGKLSGELQIKAPRGATVQAQITGQLEGTALLLPLVSGETITIENIKLVAEGAHLNADVTTLVWKELLFGPLKATIALGRDRIDVDLTDAVLCGIDLPGQLALAGETIFLDLGLAGKGLDVATSYTCLTRGRVDMTGSLEIASRVSAEGAGDELIGKLQGPLSMIFTKGVIKQSKVLSRVLAVLNITEIVKGKLPDLTADGFAYSTLTLQGEFRAGKLIIEKLFMDGETLDILGQGEIDIEKKTVNLELLAAPFQTVDTVIRNIPGVNYLLAGTLVTIPVSITGALGDPKVNVMSAASVGSSLLGLGERTIKAPLKLIQTILPFGDKKEP